MESSWNSVNMKYHIYRNGEQISGCQGLRRYGEESEVGVNTRTTWGILGWWKHCVSQLYPYQYPTLCISTVSISISWLRHCLSDNLCRSSIGRSCLFISYNCICIYNYPKLRSFKYLNEGLPWRPRGKDSVLPMQGGQGSLSGWGTRSRMPQLSLEALTRSCVVQLRPSTTK